METLPDDIISHEILLRLSFIDRISLTLTCKKMHLIAAQYPFMYYQQFIRSSKEERNIRNNLHKLRKIDIVRNPGIIILMNEIFDQFDSDESNILKTLLYDFSYLELKDITERFVKIGQNAAKIPQDYHFTRIFALAGFHKEYANDFQDWKEHEYLFFSDMIDGLAKRDIVEDFLEMESIYEKYNSYKPWLIYNYYTLCNFVPGKIMDYIIDLYNSNLLNKIIVDVLPQILSRLTKRYNFNILDRAKDDIIEVILNYQLTLRAGNESILTPRYQYIYVLLLYAKDSHREPLINWKKHIVNMIVDLQICYKNTSNNAVFDDVGTWFSVFIPFMKISKEEANDCCANEQYKINLYQTFFRKYFGYEFE